MTRTQRTFVVAAGIAAIVAAANASHGAYFSQSWGWVALAFLVPTTVLLILDRVTRPGRLRIALASLMGAFAVWVALSSLWSISSSASIREVERMLVYLAVALAIAIVLRRGDGPGVLAGAFVGVTLVAAYGLATRLFPDRIDAYDDPFNEYRLAEPLGYWNALGLLATMGLIVAVGFVAHARRMSMAMVAAGATPVLALTLYFTFSRGGWAALVIGLVAAVAVDPRRLRLFWTAIVLAVPSAACVAYASQQQALTTKGALAAEAAREGHRVAVVLGAVALASALAGFGARVIGEKLKASRRVRRGFDVALVAAAMVGLVTVLSAVGGLSGIQSRFNAAPATAVDLNDRLFNVSGNGRSELFRVGWNAGRDRPVVGQGSGSFEYIWYERRPTLLIVRDGHSLFIETFAELGIIGLMLLMGTLLVIVAGGVRARRHRFVATGLGALAAWLAASAFDWHWEMVGVTLTALLVGSVGLVALERGARPPAPGSGVRVALIGLTTVLSVLAVWSLVGNQALFASREALVRKDWSDARVDARRAQALLPWSFEPDVVIGDAAAGMGDREAALRAYRDAVETDPRVWAAWLRLAEAARGAERRAAYDRVRRLNPLAEGLPGE